MDIFDMINYLAMVNYYVEAVSGSLNTPSQTLGNLAAPWPPSLPATASWQRSAITPA